MSISSDGSGEEVPRNLRISCFALRADVALDLADDEVWNFGGKVESLSRSMDAISFVRELIFAVAESFSLVNGIGLVLDF
jgi:hypothetical protein